MSRARRRTASARWVPLLAIPIAVTILAACSSDGGEGAAPQSEPAEEGAALYESNCASCHGSDLRGTDRGPSHLSIVYEPGHHPDESFRAAIVGGAAPHHWDFGPMPPVRGLDDDEVDAVIAFVRDEQERQGFEQP